MRYKLTPLPMLNLSNHRKAYIIKVLEDLQSRLVNLESAINMTNLRISHIEQLLVTNVGQTTFTL